MAETSNNSNGIMPREMAGQVDLVSSIDFSQLECLNQKTDATIQNAVKEDSRSNPSSVVESDADEQLLIHITFLSGVAMGGIMIQGPEDSGPKKIKLFKNEPTIGFQEAESRKGVVELELTQIQLANQTFIPLQRVQFARVTVLTIFVENNQEDTDSTKISWIGVSGWPGETMNVNEIKKGEEQ
eukprot:TRINITY_DN3485_c0_g1_i1.p2 TRINITY_DN3485_c0_g1~~TRINITY_DN3485_c0_g1_i1.p2  ORF type:complete len:184 (-),score=17.85 TRINITY_DN3485_c0_g1_i1:232-783(-)